MSVASVCSYLGMTRQNYYARRRKRQRRKVDADLIKRLVEREREQQSRLGTRKLHHILKPKLEQAGVRVGRDRLNEELRSLKLLLAPLPVQYPHTTQSSHSLRVYGNKIKDLEVTGPNQVWVSDITYIRTWEKFVFLSLITDKHSRKIVGWELSETLEANGCVRALERALAELPEGYKPIHHSDRGSQYCSHEYIGRLEKAGLGISMTEIDHCAENALAERMNGILKQEYGLGVELPSQEVALVMIRQAIHLYNTRRPHLALNYRVPADVHA